MEHDPRIRRTFKNVKGQHNVEVWQWVGPDGTTFEEIGVSDREHHRNQARVYV